MPTIGFPPDRPLRIHQADLLDVNAPAVQIHFWRHDPQFLDSRQHGVRLCVTEGHRLDPRIHAKRSAEVKFCDVASLHA